MIGLQPLALTVLPLYSLKWSQSCQESLSYQRSASQISIAHDLYLKLPRLTIGLDLTAHHLFLMDLTSPSH